MSISTEQFLKLIDDRKDELFSILRGMIHIDSQNFMDGTGREEAMANHLSDVFKNMGLEPDVFSPLEEGIESHPDYFAGRHLENRPCCVAVFPGSDHSKRIMLAGHEDTVIIGDPSRWTKDPFGGEIEDGKLYGRGSGDDKVGIAVPVFLCKLFKESGIVLPYDIVIAGYSDEENGGSNGALAVNLRYPCDEALNLDGEMLDITCAGAGGGDFKVVFKCDEYCDSAANVLDAFDIFRKEMLSFKADRQAEFEANPLFKDTEIPYTTLRYLDIKSGFEESAMDRLEALVEFYTVHDKETTFKQFENIKASVNDKCKDLNVHIESWEMATRFFNFTENMHEDSKAFNILHDAVEKVTGEDKKPIGMCLSDFPMFTNYGTPTAMTFGCGRFFDMEGGAHQFDEYIECDKLVEFTKIIALFLLNYKF